MRACLKTKRIIDTRFAKGARHDFSLYKHSKSAFPEEVECLADSGYQGLPGIHENSRTPFKKPKGGQLTEQEKEFNRKLASERVVIEHIIRHLKIFRILSERYRNRRRRFMLRVNLIAGLYDYSLNHRLSFARGLIFETYYS